jgi:hypothetical protein
MADASLAEAERPTVNPASLTREDAARLLSAAGGRTVTVDMIQAAVAAGAPVAADGRMNLVELMAWLEKDLAARP